MSMCLMTNGTFGLLVKVGPAGFSSVKNTICPFVSNTSLWPVSKDTIYLFSKLKQNLAKFKILAKFSKY